MKEEYVSYECAIKLKELGFSEKVNHGYSRKMRIEPDLSYGNIKEVHSKDPKNYNDNRKGVGKGHFFYSAPRLDQAVAWLRSKGMFLMINPRYYQGDAKWCFIVQPLDDISRQYRSECCGRLFDTYEFALSAGIDKALGLLTDKLNEIKQ
ncbi:MAG: hypothetical protein K2M59_06920 [Muribaculaceae bacterium]|nr:hypothetical protein [Muribaculaceae bacterium]